MGGTASQKKEGTMSVLLRIALACLPWPEAAPVQEIAEAAGPVRHVWANGLVLKAAPDARAPELLHLPRGTTVVLPFDAATPVTHRAVAARHGVCVALEGHWREALAQGRRGWVFDGCLSRYPTPGDCDAEDLAYAARVFGAAEAGVLGRETRKWILAEHAGAAEIYWTRVAFAASGERMKMSGQGATENLAVEGMPLTFNEALLWWLHFHRADR
jgi:hypothetical protein